MIIDKVLIFIQKNNITKAFFEKNVGLSNGYLANIKKSGSEIQPKMLEKILKAYPELERKLENKTSSNSIPLIPIDAMAGFASGSVQVMEYETEKFVIPTFKGADFLINVKGSSMYPKYNSGDIVACKKLNISDIFFQWNKVYVLDTDKGALIKRVRKGSNEGYITCISDNESYEPFD